MAEEIEEAINESGYNKVIFGKHKVFQRKCLGDNYRYTSFELAILHYHGTIEQMKQWVAKNVEENQFEYLDVAVKYTEYLEDNYYDVSVIMTRVRKYIPVMYIDFYMMIKRDYKEFRK